MSSDSTPWMPVRSAKDGGFSATPRGTARAAPRRNSERIWRRPSATPIGRTRRRLCLREGGVDALAPEALEQCGLIGGVAVRILGTDLAGSDEVHEHVVQRDHAVRGARL